jgi:hypothetical protein
LAAGEYDPRRGGPSPALVAALESDWRTRMTEYLNSLGQELEPPAGFIQPTPAEAARLNNQEMDRLESILLDAEWLVPRFEDYELITVLQCAAAVRLLNMAVLRAMARNDPEKAERLLLKGIEAWQRLYPWAFPDGDELLDGLVDLYLADFKCGCDRCAKDILGADDYISVIKASLKRISRKTDVIIRHILLPGHRECCLKPMLAWIVRELPETKVSLKSDYIPPPRPCRSPVQYVSEEEYRFALMLAKEMRVNLIS